MKPVQIEKLRFENVSFQFDGNDHLFQNVDFEFPMNQLVWVKAEHGAGRSSLLQLLASLQVPTKGSYWINDQNVSEMSFEEFLPYRIQIGYGFDTGGLIHNRTVLENLMLPLNYHKVAPAVESAERVKAYLKNFGLWKYKDLRPSFIPGGTRKLVCMVRSLVLHPQVLLLDDPTVGLSQDVALKFFDEVQSLRNQGIVKHVFVSSFDDKFMQLLDNTEIFIEGGLLHALPATYEKRAVNI